MALRDVGQHRGGRVLHVEGCGSLRLDPETAGRERAHGQIDVGIGTGGYRHIGGAEVREQGWPLARDPYVLETSVPGVFVAGDVRARSIKRVASAVGEGSMAVSLIHEYLASA